MKKLSLFLLSLLVICITSCKKETVDVTDLLKSVPSSAAGVVVVNMEGLLNDAGCKIKDHAVIPGDEVKKLIEQASSQNREDLLMLFDGSTGIEPKGAVIFYDANRTFLTFALYDVDKFINFVDQKNGTSFSDEGSGVKVNGNTAVKGAQAWVCLSTGKRIDPDAIANYATLGSAQSFLVTPMGEKLLTEENDVRGWTLIETFTNNFLDRSNRSKFTLALGFLFEGAESVSFKVDFKKGELDAEALILNDKFKPAKYQLPAEKVDVNTLKGLGSTCDAMMAFTVTPKLIKKFDQLGQMFGGMLFGDLGDTFKNIDGTIGLVSGGDGMAESVNGVVTTKGEVSQTLRGIISEYMGTVTMDNKLLKFSKGDVKGNLNVEECAEALKGSCLGIVVDATGFSTMGYGEAAPAGFKSLMMKLEPESGGIEIEIEAKTSNPSDNALLSILKRAGASS